MRRTVMAVLTVAALLLCAWPVSVSADTGKTVRTQAVEKAQEVYEECLEAGVTGEYATALWLHDWIICHADFDNTYTYYGPEGVLLYGKGVCQSYALAYQLLLDCAGIENMLINALPDMDHAWNLVKINGNWCHIDCTWDDPGSGGGETHMYFGLSDTLMRRDHKWPQGTLPEATGLENYYPLQSGLLCVCDRESMLDLLNAEAEVQNEEISLCYTGDDGSFSLVEVLEEWFSEYNWKYGLAAYSVSSYGYGVRVSVTYTTPWQRPENMQPVQSPAFVLDTPDGQYSSDSLLGNGLLLILGSAGDRNTTNLLSRLNGINGGLNNIGVATIVGIDGATSAKDLSSIAALYPGFTYAYGTSVLWAMLDAVGYDTSGTVAYPIVFILNGSGQIIYYTVGPVANTDQLISTAYTVATGNPISEPVQPFYGGKCNVPMSNVSGTTASQLRQLSQNGETVLFLYDYSIYDEELTQMQLYENNYNMYKTMNIRLVVCARWAPNLGRYKAQYPHVDFLTDDGSILWSLLNAVGWPQNTQAYYMSSYLICNDHIVDYTNGSQISCSALLGETAFSIELSSPLPASLTVIEDQAFAWTCFETIDFSGTSVQRICSEAFLDCTSLKFVKIPAGVIVEENAFRGCANLTILCEFGSSAYYYAINNGISCMTRN